MASTMAQSAHHRLERSCGLPRGRAKGQIVQGDWIRMAPSSPGVERLEAAFSGHAFAPHRHDTYAIGATLSGVQAFGYRGAARHSLAGETFVLHPDEPHDGRAGSAAGFRYRILYVAPALIQRALGGGALPFVPGAVARSPRLTAALRPILADLEQPLAGLALDEALVGLADALAALDASARRPAPATPHRRAVARARDLLDTATGPVTSAQLETASGLDRYALARHFRACLGTSPYRYWTLRRLERARGLFEQGAPLAEAAADCGFADQSHMTRQFKAAYGITPRRWLALRRH